MQSERNTVQSIQESPKQFSMQRALATARAAIDKKAENVKILDLTDLSGFTEYFVVCSGISTRQVQAIANSVEHVMDSTGHGALSLEGYNEGRWVLLDFGDVVVHVFLDVLRDYYDLESLWANAPRVKIPPEFYAPGASPLN